MSYLTGDGLDLSGFGGVSPRGGSRSKREVGVEMFTVDDRGTVEFADGKNHEFADGARGGDDGFDNDTPMLTMPPPPPPEYA